MDGIPLLGSVQSVSDFSNSVNHPNVVLQTETKSGTLSALSIDAEQPREDALNGRWVLFVYCFFSSLQTMMWAVPGTVSTTLTAVYPHSISPFDIQLVLSWGAIFFIPFAIPVAYWLARPHGIRRCTIVGTLLLTLGAACRCAAQTDSESSLVLWHLSGVCAGLANPIASERIYCIIHVV